MSGPKRADVQAALKSAEAAGRKSAELVSASETAALKSLLRKAQDALGNADRSSGAVAAASAELAQARGDIPAVGAARSSIGQAQGRLDEAKAAAAAAREALAQAVKLDGQAGATFKLAQAEYDRAERDLRNSGGHYLRSEMEGAQRAKALFDQAAREGAQAATARAAAKQAAARAMDTASSATSAASTAVSRSAAARKESDERIRAEAEARRIAEEAKRRATLAVDAARGAIGGLDAESCDKFRPGQRSGLAQRLAGAEQSLNRGDSGSAERAATPLPPEAAQLAGAVAEARREFERLRAQALSGVAQLESAIEGSDGPLIGKWSDTPQALDDARRSLAQAQAAIAAEDFAGATGVCSTQVAALAEATRTAAESVAADARRTSIGEAVMDVLEEMGFDVSFEQGSKTEPLRIAGQTADAQGKGDFDLEIPLDGEVDFEVTAQQGDGSCSSAVLGLQKRLAERGVGWQTTDWGYGHEPTEQEAVRTQTRTVEETRTRTRNQ